MSKNKAAPAVQEKKKRHIVVHAHKATKSSKVQSILAPRFGIDGNVCQRLLNDADATFEAWRKDGFRGAWWKRYFKNDAGAES
jgi:hypothetical protein